MPIIHDPTRNTTTINKRVIAACLVLMLIASAIAILCWPRSSAKANNKETAARAVLSDAVSVQARGKGGPRINLSDGRDVITPFSGDRDLVQALEANDANALSLASADFDEDEVPDLISGYSHPGGGIVTLMRGNVDSIYTNSPEAQRRRAEGAFTDAPFLSPAYVFSVPDSVDFIGAGDFDGDSHWDVVTAKQGNDKLHLLRGDGHGGLHPAKAIELPGDVTSLTVGEINRRDGLDDLAVGVVSEGGAKVLVYEGREGALKSKPEVFDAPSEVSSIVLGQLDHGYEMDMAIAAGHELMLVHGRDRKLFLDAERREEVRPAKVEHRRFPFTIVSLAVGDFTGDQTSDIALLSKNGTLSVLSRTEAKQPPAVAGQNEEVSIARLKRRVVARGNWSDRGQLVSARVSSTPVNNLVVTDPVSRTLEVIALSDGELVKGETASSGSDSEALRVGLDAQTELAAVLPMRLNPDALTDLVILRRGATAPSLIATAAAQTFTVTNTFDSGAGTLRQALINANANPGADTIAFNIASGGRTISLRSFLPNIDEAVTIDGTTQPGFAGSPLIELDGTNSTPDFPAFTVYAGNTTIRGLVINRFKSNGIDLLGNGNSIIEGNFIGTDVTGTVDLGNIFRGVNVGENGPINHSTNNRIGGTTLQARNVISGNNVHGVRILGTGSTGNIVQGNLIGTDITGKLRLGNAFEGLYIGGGINNTVGGTQAGAGNTISANGFTGDRSAGLDISTFPFLTGATGNIVQGNLVGTDVEGKMPLGNATEGILINVGASSNTVGGATPSARNVISGNATNGIDIGFDIPVTSNVVEGNYIGTDASGTQPIANGLSGIFVNANSVGNTVKTNLIAFNGNSGVFIPNRPPDPGAPGVRISIISNQIFLNSGIGIDIGEPGVTPNDDKDVDTGANELQNFPEFTSVTNGGTTIIGTLNSTPNTEFTIQIFYTPAANGLELMMAGPAIPPQLIATIKAISNANGVANVAANIQNAVTGGTITGTATDPKGNTSEISPPLNTGGPTGPGLSISSAARDKKKLIITGTGFKDGAELRINGEKQKKVSVESETTIIAKKSGKLVKSGDTLKVTNTDGSFVEYRYP